MRQYMEHNNAPDDRYETQIEDGIVYLEGERGRLEVGPLETIVDNVGGETYTIQYDAQEVSLYDWLDEDSETLEIDVCETLSSYTLPTTVVHALAEIPLAGQPTPTRPAYFADVVTRIWDNKGDIDAIDELTQGHAHRE